MLQLVHFSQSQLLQKAEITSQRSEKFDQTYMIAILLF